jgi:hypothetical protein
MSNPFILIYLGGGGVQSINHLNGGGGARYNILEPMVEVKS